jgi:cytochrome c oxidase cbb3-type subunit 4
MDSVNFLRTLGTVGSLVMFIVIAFWAWSARNRERFDEAAQLPFEEE